MRIITSDERKEWREQVISIKVPSYTCNDINAALGSVLSVIKKCKKEDNNDFADEILIELSDVEDQLECVRSANEQLRELGIEQHELAKEIMIQRNECLDILEETEERK